MAEYAEDGYSEDGYSTVWATEEGWADSHGRRADGKVVHPDALVIPPSGWTPAECIRPLNNVVPGNIAWVKVRAGVPGDAPAYLIGEVYTNVGRLCLGNQVLIQADGIPAEGCEYLGSYTPRIPPKVDALATLLAEHGDGGVWEHITKREALEIAKVVVNSQSEWGA